MSELEVVEDYSHPKTSFFLKLTNAKSRLLSVNDPSIRIFSCKSYERFVMKRMCWAAMLLLVASPCFAEDLASFGLATLEPVTDSEATEVRGLGGYSDAYSLGVSGLSAVILDPATGSQGSFNATQTNLGKEQQEFGLDATGADQASGVETNTAAGLAGLGSVGDFSFSLVGVSGFASGKSIAGATSGFDFTPTFNIGSFGQ